VTFNCEFLEDFQHEEPTVSQVFVSQVCVLLWLWWERGDRGGGGWGGGGEGSKAKEVLVYHLGPYQVQKVQPPTGQLWLALAVVVELSGVSLLSKMGGRLGSLFSDYIWCSVHKEMVKLQFLLFFILFYYFFAAGTWCNGNHF